jgi:hypothetical protein
MNNPGPYVAAGYSQFPKAQEPTKEDDLKFPSLDDERAKIADSIRTVEPIRAVLDKTATREDAPALLSLLDRSSENRENCGLRMAAAIAERATERIRSLNDPSLLLQAHVLAGDADSWSAAEGFINSVTDNEDERRLSCPFDQGFGGTRGCGVRRARRGRRWIRTGRQSRLCASFQNRRNVGARRRTLCWRLGRGRSGQSKR